MRVLIPGHRFALAHLKSQDETIFDFHMDPELHDGQALEGPSTQEVIRMAIARVEELDREKPWSGNADILWHLRCAIAGFEARALIRRVEKGELPIDKLPVLDDGHIDLRCDWDDGLGGRI